MKILATKKGKIWTAVILVLALLLGILVYRFLHPTKVTDALIKRIEYEFVLYKAVNYTGRFSHVPIMFCYGVFDGCVPVHFDYSSLGIDQRVVAGHTFRVDAVGAMLIWRNGQFCYIDEAYEKGWLTDAQIAQIADIHHNILLCFDYSAGDQYWIHHGQD